MPLKLLNIQIDSVCIVDDDPNAREAYGYSVEDLDLMPVPAAGPLTNLRQFAEQSRKQTQAAICDFRLGVRNYATFNGAQLVAEHYLHQFPAVLCTKWESASIDEMRQYRRHIPVLLRPDELAPDSIVLGLRFCIEEFRGEFRPSRRPWRTLVRVEGIDEERSYVYLIIPAWDPNEVVRLRLDDIPNHVRARLGQQMRFHAQVNTGAESHEDLYFEVWESD